MRPHVTLLAALCLIPGFGCGEPQAGPNIAIVVLDTLRPDHLGCYGYERPTSPHLDAFAETAVVFENAESSSPWTAPSMISLVTSLDPDVHGVMEFPNPGRLNERVVTLPEILKQRGYATAMFTEGGYAKPEFGLDQGVDVFPLNEGDEESHYSNILHPSRIEGNVDRALEWLGARGDEPWFMLFHTYEVHEPLQAPDEYVQLFRPGWVAEEQDALVDASLERFEAEGTIEREDVLRLYQHAHHCRADRRAPAGLHKAAGTMDVEPFGPEVSEFVRDLYDAEIRFMDDQLQRLLSAIDEETIVVVVSDHGEALGEHGKIGHGTSYHAEQLGISLIVRAPGYEPRRVGDLVRGIDVMPTILDLADVRPKKLTVQGVTLVSRLESGDEGHIPSHGRGLALGGYERSQLSIRADRWRCIVDQDGSVRLYNVELDPGEARDVSADFPNEAIGFKSQIEKRTWQNQRLHVELSGGTGEIDLEDIEDELNDLGYIDAESPEDEEGQEPPAGE